MPVDLKMMGEKLHRYRSQFELSLEEVSKATGIVKTILDLGEKGEGSLTGDHLLILANFYKCDYRIFISDEKETPLDRTDTLFRTFANEFTKEDRWAVQEFLYLCEGEGFLQQQVALRKPEYFKFEKVGSYFKGHAEKAAKKLRSFLGYADNEVPRNVYDDFRKIGIHLFRRSLQNATISGLYINHPIAGDCVLINYGEDVYRQRFTAAHEAAHAIFDRENEVVVSFWDDRDLKEIRANTFASHYLMPHEFLKKIPDPTTWDEAKLVEWSHELRVNTQPLLIALSEAGLIHQDTASNLKFVKIRPSSKLDPELPESLPLLSRRRKEVLLKRGLSTSYVSLCFDAYRRATISAARLMELLLLDGNKELKELSELYGETIEYGD
jgi:Zn-dependent peptidase ImmA (M78 family)